MSLLHPCLTRLIEVYGTVRKKNVPYQGTVRMCDTFQKLNWSTIRCYFTVKGARCVVRKFWTYRTVLYSLLVRLLFSCVNATDLISRCKTWLQNYDVNTALPMTKLFYFTYKNYRVSRPILSYETTMFRDQDRDQSESAQTKT